MTKLGIDTVGSDKKIILHVGAHRTATKRFQRLLNANIDEFSEVGIEIASHEYSNAGKYPPVYQFLLPLLHRSRRSDEPWNYSLVHRIGCHLRSKKHLRGAIAQGTNGVIVSEETILGDMFPLLAYGEFYEHAGRRVSQTIDVVGETPSTIVLGIRSYDQLYASIYAFCSGLYVLPDFEIIKSQLFEIERGWNDVVRDLLEHTSVNSILIWPLDHSDERQRLASIFSCELIERLVIQNSRENESPSTTAIETMRKLRAQRKLTWEERMEIVKAGGNDRFQPWSSQEQSTLQGRYAQDLNKLSELDRVKVVGI